MKLSTGQLRAMHCSRAVAVLSEDDVRQRLPLVDGWLVHNAKLCRSFVFRDYHETMAFVNALAWMTHNEDHHPALLVTFKNCTVSYDTHSVNGISDNDFICAAKADAIYAQRAGA
jgi:4a-hydroxytetrahydrobiopterin dehydratase